MAIPISSARNPAIERAHEMDDSEGKADRRIIWVFLWTLFGFKLATVLVVLWMSGATAEANLIMSATSWPFLILPMVALAGPMIYLHRVRRVRAKREQLIRAEWMVD